MEVRNLVIGDRGKSLRGFGTHGKGNDRAVLTVSTKLNEQAADVMPQGLMPDVSTPTFLVSLHALYVDARLGASI